MKTYTLYQVDSFTKEKFKGNPAGVVPNADGLSKEQMQLIAREVNNSETSFLFSPDDNSCDGVIRYFTPQTEVPICGHATIAAMYIKAIEENLDSKVYRIKTNIGVLPFVIEKKGESYRVIMTQGKIEFEKPLDNEVVNRILIALGIYKNDLEPKCPVQIVSTGHSKVIIGIKSRKQLNELNPKMFELAEISKLIKCNGYFVFTFDSDDREVLTCGRMFAPAIGINEDPVTGNANGPLGAYLVYHKLVKASENEFCFRGKQGEAINRLGIVDVNVKIENDEPVQVKIAGEAVVVFKTEIQI